MIYDGAANRITRPPRIARWPSDPLTLFYIALNCFLTSRILHYAQLSSILFLAVFCITLNYLLTERILHYAKLSSTLFPKSIDSSGILHKKA